MRILKTSVRYFGAGRYSGLAIFTIKSEHRPLPLDFFDLGIGQSFCSHSHDCCGCVQIEHPYVERHAKRREWIVYQRFYRNV